MILCRRPIKVYDCDVVGLLVVAGLGMATVLAMLPLLSTQTQKAGLGAALAEARKGLHQSGETLRKIRRQANELEALESQQRGALVSANEMTTSLAGLAGKAAEFGLTLTEIAPQPASAAGELVAIDVRIAASGRAVDLMRLLHALQVEYPWVRLERLEIHATEAAQEQCALSAVIRWFALPSAGGDRST